SFKQFWLKKKNRHLFPVLARRLLTLGERNQNYQTEIQILAQILTEELDNELKHFIAVFEPVLIICIACLVALLALTLQNVLSQAQTAVIAG
ncbi:MAG: type II secretion system F family protein, partial [Candidatus Jacksonbacteria bacterium]